MVPIYDSDLAEERYSKDEWSQYELWEKVENRLRRRRRLWIAGACLGFLCLSSIPIVIERAPKWASLSATRRLAEEINAIKIEASLSHAAYRIRFQGSGRLDYAVEKLANCSSGGGETVRSGSLMNGPRESEYALVGPEAGKRLGIDGFVESICYDYLSGSDVVLSGEGLAGFGVAPVNDLTGDRTDRLAVLLVSGPSAEVTFE